ncbi:MAG: diguanylate cyclase [Magnetococcus sp. WYHC-3]
MALVGLSVMAGLISMLVFFTQHQRQSTLEQNERTVRLMVESISRGLQTVMLSGYADIAQNYVENIKSIPAILEFRIMRVTGEEAFKDNRTIDEINRRSGGQAFPPRTQTEPGVRLPPEQMQLVSSLSMTGPVSLYETGTDGIRRLTFLAPINSREECHGCHEDNTSVRGVLKLTTSLQAVEEDIQRTQHMAVVLILLSLATIILLTALLIRRIVVLPLAHITCALRRLSEGDLSIKVPVVSRDELGDMATSFNQMAGELERSYTELRDQQDKLTTIIHSTKEGVVVTNRAGQVVLVNPAAERLLGKEDARIRKEGFFSLIDDPEYVHKFLENQGKEMPETLVYNNRVLNFHASTICTAEQLPIGSAALIRDVTEEKKLEEQLRRLSTTDGLTGLINRRHMDELLVEELNRARRYNLAMAVLLFDVDHFKKFNDQYGHDQGDRVLISIGQIMKSYFRAIDFPCRYGGEEFCVILPSTGSMGALQVAERFRQKVQEMDVDGLKVTISIGVATYPESRADSAGAMLKRADGALYAAKKAGRNNVQMALAEGEVGALEHLRQQS